MSPTEVESFDAEFYLRRHAEDEFGLSEGDETRTPKRAQALVVLGLLPLARARAILQLYRRARALRHEGEYYDDDDEWDEATGPAASRVVLLDRALEAPFGTLHLRYVTLGNDQVRMAVKIDFGKGGPRGGFRHGPPGLPVTDDQGTTTELHFDGGGGGRTWRGHFTSGDRLSMTTAWLDVFGQRVGLADRPSDAAVRVDDVLAQDGADLGARAARYLEHCLQRDTQRRWHDSVPVALETVLASGILAADSPVVADVRAVHRAVSQEDTTDPQALPEPWRTMLAPATSKRRGPKGDVPISASTPVFDGIGLTVYVLSARRSRFEVELDGRRSASDELLSDDHASPVTFTAVDDLGHRYLGNTQAWHSSGSEFGGTVSYQPPLDPAAASIDLEFNTTRSRAVITVPLTWAASS